MHQLYETEAYVLRVTPYGEADAVVVLLTKDFGVVRATVRGIRYEKSKLRFVVQPYTKIRATLVQGKEMWRLTNAQGDVALTSTAHEEQLLLVARISKLLERLISGEEVDTKLFAIVDSGFSFIDTSQDDKQLTDIESVLVLRILHHLGYVGAHENLAFYVADTSWNSALVEQMQSERKSALRVINQAIQESQL